MAAAAPTVSVKEALARAQEAMLLLNKSVGNPMPAGISVVSTAAGPATAAAPLPAAEQVPILVVQQSDGEHCAASTTREISIGDEIFPSPLSYYAKMTMAPTPRTTKVEDILSTVLGSIAANRTKVQELMTRVNRLNAPAAAAPIKTAYMEFLTAFLADLGKTEEIRAAITANLKWFGLSGTSKVHLVVRDALSSTFAPSLKAAIEAENAFVSALESSVASLMAPAAPAAATAPAPAEQAGGARRIRGKNRTRAARRVRFSKTRKQQH